MNWKWPSRMTPAFAFAVATLVPTAPMAGRSADRAFPAVLAGYLDRYAKLSAEERTRLLAGDAVTKPLDADPATEVAIFGMVWVDAPLDRYIAAVKDIERLERGGNFLITKRISSPPRLEDFEALALPEQDIADLKDCRIGSCDVKLGAPALEGLRKEVDWSKPDAASDVNRVMRALALEYAKGYLEGGNKRLAVYRDSERPTFVANEFGTLIERMPGLTGDLGDVKRYLLDYPNATLANADSFLYWQNAKFGLKPTIRINHVTIAPRPGGAIVASKMLYATHYFWTALETRALVSDPARGTGFWFASVSRSRSDGLSGFKGSLIRGRVRGEAEKAMTAALRATKATLEGAPLP